MSERYAKSEEMMTRALKTIPLGSQTFSKSKTQYPFGVSPYFIHKGQGSRVWDVDGNEYIDFVNGLSSITLGYNDPDVNKTVMEQFENGVIFSLAHPLEHQVAELIVEMVPCAEMVRFGKNGSDATSGAIRLARAYTKRDYVAVCGYHGWQDWYIGSTARNLGVPEATRELTLTFQYNRIESLEELFEKHPGKIACVILEPMTSVFPENRFLEEVQELTHKHGALLIFDETITGFRFANGGAQQYFGVTPDLATFGKGLANGYPVSAVAGKREIMTLMEEIFFSFTFGGETLSLAASLATLKKLKEHPVVETNIENGSTIKKFTQSLISKHALDEFISISGHPTWTIFQFQDTNGYSLWEIKTFFLQEMFARGILTFGTHNISYAHNNEDVLRLSQVYDEVFSMLHKAVGERKLESLLRCKPLEPLFKVRQ